MPRYLEALKKIANWEYRADRRHKGMVDVSEIESLKRIARAAIAKTKKKEGGKPCSTP